MSVARVKNWIVEILTASDLNAEFNNILNNGEDLGWPATKAKDLDGNELILDSDADTSITADSDDVIDVRVGGSDSLFIGHGTGNTAGFLHVNPGSLTATASTDFARLRINNSNAMTIPAGTTTIAAAVYIAEPNLTATGTITNAATLYIPGAPTEGGTTNHALFVDSGTSRFDGAVEFADGTASLPSITNVGDVDTGMLFPQANQVSFAANGLEVIRFGHGTANTGALINIDNGAFTATANTNIGKLRLQNTNAMTIPAGTTAVAAAVYLEEPNLTATGTVTNAATLYIQNAPTEGTNDYALFVDAGDARFDGNVLMPAQPAFLAYNSATDDNQTGNGAVATVDFDTEIFDQGADFTGDTFTAPVSGRYLLHAEVRVTGITSAADTLSIALVTSNRTYTNIWDATNAIPGSVTRVMSTVADMDASDTVTVTCTGSGESSDVMDIVGAATPDTAFSGCLLA